MARPGWATNYCHHSRGGKAIDHYVQSARAAAKLSSAIQRAKWLTDVGEASVKYRSTLLFYKVTGASAQPILAPTRPAGSLTAKV